MIDETLRDLRNQVCKSYTIVTRSYDGCSGRMTSETRTEHPEPYIKLTHDQGVELLALINKLESERQVTHESAIDFLHNEGWMQKHDEELTKAAKLVPPKPIKKRLDQVYGVTGGDCPNCRNWVQSSHVFCGFCGQAVKWND